MAVYIDMQSVAVGGRRILVERSAALAAPDYIAAGGDPPAVPLPPPEIDSTLLFPPQAPWDAGGSSGAPLRASQLLSGGLGQVYPALRFPGYGRSLGERCKRLEARAEREELARLKGGAARLPSARTINAQDFDRDGKLVVPLDRRFSVVFASDSESGESTDPHGQREEGDAPEAEGDVDLAGGPVAPEKEREREPLTATEGEGAGASTGDQTAPTEPPLGQRFDSQRSGSSSSGDWSEESEPLQYFEFRPEPRSVGEGRGTSGRRPPRPVVVRRNAADLGAPGAAEGSSAGGLPHEAVTESASQGAPGGAEQHSGKTHVKLTAGPVVATEPSRGAAPSAPEDTHGPHGPRSPKHRSSCRRASSKHRASRSASHSAGQGDDALPDEKAATGKVKRGSRSHGIKKSATRRRDEEDAQAS